MKTNFRFILFFLAVNLLNAQTSDPNWTGFFSFNQIVDITASGDRVFAATQNAVLIYDTQSGLSDQITTVEGLDGADISTIAYSGALDYTIVGFENGLIQILGADDDGILTVGDIRNQSSIPDPERVVNKFLVMDDLLFIGTGFGIALYDLRNLEFIDTYLIGDNGSSLVINDLVIQDGFLYAATDGGGGLRRASLDDPFLIDFTNWTQVDTGTFERIEAFDEEIIAVAGDNSVFRSQEIFVF